MSLTAVPQIHWLFGLSASDRAQLAHALAAHLQAAGRRVTLLDGNELRAGLCEDLGYSEADVLEKVRRGAHVAKSHAASGATVICSFLTPKERHRELVSQILGDLVQLIHVHGTSQKYPICQGGKQPLTTETCDGLNAELGDFEPPSGAGAVISIHERDLAASIQTLCQLVTTTAKVQEKPARSIRRAGVTTAGGDLSAREMDVMSLLSQGLRHKEMAERLGISVTTVRTHLERACAKLSANSRTEAVARFVVLGTRR